MSKRRHKGGHEEEHENHERWLITYADMITLLMAFFIMLFAMSQIDLAKFKAFQAGVASHFDKPSGVLKGGTGLLLGNAQEADSEQAVAKMLTEQARLQAAAQRERKDLTEAQHRIEGQLGLRGLRDRARFSLQERGLVVTVVSDDVLFDSGQADLRDEGARVLNVVASVVARMPNRVLVEGHTDNRPVSGRYPSNWELSTARASAVVRYLSSNHGITASRLSAAGYADQHPAAPNNNDRNRQRNRRVEIVVVSTLDQAVATI